MEFRSILYAVEDSVAKITLNRPQAYNALDKRTFREFFEAVSEADADEGVRVITITGAGKAFCAGGDIAEFAAGLDRSSRLLKRMTLLAHGAMSRLARSRKPSLAIVNGVAAGGGIGIALGADLAVAAESAKFNLAYSGLGVSPDNSTSFYLPRLIGLRRAMEMALLNRVLSAQEAVAWGLINRAVPDDDLEAQAAGIAARLAAGPTLAYGATKRLFHQSFSNTLESQMEYEAQSIAALSETSDFREAVTAFGEKRRPVFKGVR